jgi:hypothetical protein
MRLPWWDTQVHWTCLFTYATDWAGTYRWFAVTLFCKKFHPQTWAGEIFSLFSHRARCPWSHKETAVTFQTLLADQKALCLLLRLDYVIFLKVDLTTRCSFLGLGVVRRAEHQWVGHTEVYPCAQEVPCGAGQSQWWRWRAWIAPCWRLQQEREFRIDSSLTSHQEGIFVKWKMEHTALSWCSDLRRPTGDTEPYNLMPLPSFLFVVLRIKPRASCLQPHFSHFN